MATPQRQAQTLAASIIAARRKALEAERADEQRLAQQRANAAQQAYGAAADFAAPLGQQVADTYSGSAGRIAAFADLFTKDARQKIEQATEHANQILAQNNAPGQLSSQAGPAGDVLAGLGGVIPATSLEREGAAFGAAASQLPDTLRGAGVQAGIGFLNQGAEAQRGIGRSIAELEGQRPKTTFDILQSLLESGRADRALNIQEKYLTNATTKLGSELTGTYVGADGTVYQTADARNAANAAKTEKQTAKNAARTKRNEATITAIDELSEALRTRLGGTKQKEIGRKPMQGPDLPPPPGSDIPPQPRWYRTDGSLTVDMNDPDIVREPVYETVPIDKPEYDQLRRELVRKLSRKLGRFGYKGPFFQQAADEILSDYYTVNEVAFNTAEKGVSEKNKRYGKSSRRG